MVRRYLGEGLLALTYRRRLGAHNIAVAHYSVCRCRWHHAPLGRLVLSGLLGLLRLVGRQTDGSGRPVQQALALQRSGNHVRRYST